MPANVQTNISRVHLCRTPLHINDGIGSFKMRCSRTVIANTVSSELNPTAAEKPDCGVVAEKPVVVGVSCATQLITVEQSDMVCWPHRTFGPLRI